MYLSQTNHNNNVHESDLTDEFSNHLNNLSQTIPPSISPNHNYPIYASNSNNITIFSDYLQSYAQFNVQNKLRPKLQYLENEIKTIIFKYIDHPLNLASTCRNWSVIAKNSYVKSEWLLENYGKENALFHAIRLGTTFIDAELLQILIAREIISSANNGDALYCIIKLPRQAVNDLPSMNRFFNGSSFN